MGNVTILGAVNMLGGFIFGYNTGIIAGVLNIFKATASDSKWHLSETMSGIVTSSILIGALIGSMIGGPIADKFGRKVGVITLATISLVFAPLLAIVPSVDTLIVARSFLGLGVGMAGIICPMYVSEMAPPERRGPLGILFQLAITIGIFVAYITNYGFEHVKYSWRIMFGLGAVPALILFAIGFIMPESGEWLGKKHGERMALLRTNEATRPLSEQINLFLHSRSLYIGIVLAVAQQLTGINAFMFYAGDIFSAAGLNNPNFPTMGLGAWNVLATVAAVPLVGKFGRRPLLIVGTLIMTIASVGLGLVFGLIKHDEHAKGALAILLLLLFVAAFEIGDGPLFWIVAHELFTPEIKTVGASTLNAAQWIFNIMLSFGFPSAVKLIGQANVFYVFGAFGGICTLIMMVALPETRNAKPVSDI